MLKIWQNIPYYIKMKIEFGFNESDSSLLLDCFVLNTDCVSMDVHKFVTTLIDYNNYNVV